MVGGALVRVVARLAAAVEERPVARLHGEQLARRPLGGRPGADRRASARSSRSSSRRAAQARSATAGESQVRRSLSSPQLEAAAAAPRARGARRPRASVTSSTPCSAAAASTSSSQAGPSHHQCPSSSVSIAKTSSPRRPRSAANRRQPGRDGGGELAGRARGRGPRGRVRVVRGRRRSPTGGPAQRLAMEVREGGVGRVAVERPEPADRLPVDRERQRAGRGRDRRQRRRRRLVRALVGAEVARAPARPSSRSSPGSIGALREPEAARRAEAAPVRAQPGVDLQPAAGAGREQRQHRVGGRRGDQLDPALGGRACEQIAAGPRRRAPRAARARGGSGRPRPARVAVRRLDVRGVGVRGRDPKAAQELAACARRTPGASSWSASTGVTVIVSPRRTLAEPARRSGSRRRTATPPRTGRCRSPPRRACGCGGRSPRRRRAAPPLHGSASAACRLRSSREHGRGRVGLGRSTKSEAAIAARSGRRRAW